MSLDARKNFALSTVDTAPSPATTGTTLNVPAGQGSKFPAAPFNAVVWPTASSPTSSNAEIVRVTSKGSGDDWTIDREEEGTTARTIIVGDQIMQAPTDKSLKDIEDYVTGVSSPTLLQPTIADFTNANHDHLDADDGGLLGSKYLRIPGEIAAYGGKTAPTDWLLCYGQAVSRATYSALYDIIAPSLGTFTVTIASPGVVTLNSHGLVTGDSVFLTTTGALPTGLTANTLYYVIYVDANTFRLATSRANALVPTPINTTGSQSGTHTLRYCPYGLGDGSTTFNLPDLRGRVPAGADAMGGTAATRLTLARSQGTYGQMGAAGGVETHTLITAELAAHSHDMGSGTNQWVSGGSPGSDTAASITQTGSSFRVRLTGTDSAGSGTAHNNVQPTLIVNYIIKT